MSNYHSTLSGQQTRVAVRTCVASNTRQTPSLDTCVGLVFDAVCLLPVDCGVVDSL